MWFLFSHLDLDGRSGERETRVCYMSLSYLIDKASKRDVTNTSVFPFHGGAARVIPLHQQNSSCTGIDIQTLWICSEKCHKSSVISLKMKKTPLRKYSLQSSEQTLLLIKHWVQPPLNVKVPGKGHLPAWIQTVLWGLQPTTEVNLAPNGIDSFQRLWYPHNRTNKQTNTTGIGV